MTTARATPPRVQVARAQAVASIWPLVMGTIGLVLGTALAVWTATQSEIQPFWGDVRLPFAPESTLPLSVGGYVLTPFVVFAALGWDRIAQQQGLRDRNFALKPNYARALQTMSVISMGVAFWHILNIAYVVSGA